MVNNLSIFLFLIHAVWQRFVSYQFVNDCFKNNIEVLDKQFLIEVYFPLLVYRIQIDWSVSRVIRA